MKVIAAALTLLTSTHAFTPITPRVQTAVQKPFTALASTSSPADEVKQRDTYNRILGTNMPLGEANRINRRDVYTQEDWVKARSDQRFFDVLSKIGKSAILGQLFDEVIIVSSVALFCILWNGILVTGFTDFGGVQHDALVGIPSFLMMKLPLEPFTLSSSALGLLLVFRTNSSYARWWEARGCWGLIINHSRNIMRIASAWSLQSATPENSAERKRKLSNVATAAWEFPRALTRHLLRAAEDEDDFQREMRTALDPAKAEYLIGVRHRPTRALYDLSTAVQDLNLSFLKKIEIDKSITVLINQAGACEKILSAPVPLVYNRHTARMLSAWLLLLPFGLYQPMSSTWNHLGLIPTVAVISFFFFGIEELAVQLEEPFSILPMHAMTRGIGLSVNEYDQWHTDNEAAFMNRQPVPRVTDRTPINDLIGDDMSAVGSVSAVENIDAPKTEMTAIEILEEPKIEAGKIETTTAKNEILTQYTALYDHLKKRMEDEDFKGDMTFTYTETNTLSHTETKGRYLTQIQLQKITRTKGDKSAAP